MTTNEVADVLINCANGACDKCYVVFKTDEFGAVVCQDELIKDMGAELRKICEGYDE